MAFSTGGPKGFSSEINVTPLIDVLLVLLIIFMVIVPLAPLGLNTTLPLPNDRRSAAPPPMSPVLVQLDGDSTHPAYRVDGVSVAGDGIDARLRAILAPRADRLMLVQADAGMEFGAVTEMVDRGRADGAETVGLLTPGVRP